MRARVAVALHHLCIEHRAAGHVLVDSDVRGSAFALYRPQFEAYVRANWYFDCASEIKDEIRQSFTDEHTGQLIDAMAMLSYLGALGIAKVADDGELAQRLYGQHQEVYAALYDRA